MSSLSHNETADDYRDVIVTLAPGWRVIACADGIQWIIQQRKKGGGRWPWRARHYCVTRKAPIRLSATSCERLAPSVRVALDALPEVFGIREGTWWSG